MVEAPTPIPVIPTLLSNVSISGIRDEPPPQLPQKSWRSPITCNENTEDSPKVRALLEKVQKLEQLLSDYMPDGVSDRVLGKPLPPIRPTTIEPRAQIRGILSKTRFFGQSHWMNSIRLVRLFLKFTQKT